MEAEIPKGYMIHILKKIPSLAAWRRRKDTDRGRANTKADNRSNRLCNKRARKAKRLIGKTD